MAILDRIDRRVNQASTKRWNKTKMTRQLKLAMRNKLISEVNAIDQKDYKTVEVNKEDDVNNYEESVDLEENKVNNP